MKRYVLIVLLTFGFCGCGRNTWQRPSDNTTQTTAFMAQFLGDFKEPPFVQASSGRSSLLECIYFDTSFFSTKEVADIQNQLRQDHKYRWKSGQLSNTILLTNIAQDDRRRAGLYADGNHNVYTFSHPIFVRGGQYCVIYEEIRWSANAGQGTLWLYRKNGVQWERLEQLCDWIN